MATVWTRGVNYPLSTVVRYTDGNCYKVVNAGTNGSDGTDPVISTWYWERVACPSSTSESVIPWTRGVNYPLSTVVRYTDGNCYKVVNAGTNGSDGTDPVISTWYWERVACPSSTSGSTNSGFIVREEQFQKMFPRRNPFYTYQGLTQAMAAFPAFSNSGGDDVRRQEAAAFLANVAHETGDLVHIVEQQKENWSNYCNTSEPYVEGKQYYGRGPLQLSWNGNYKAAGDALNLPLLSNPDLVAQDAAVAWKTALWYWMTQKGPGSMTPHDAIVQGKGFGETIRSINGKLECGGRNSTQVQSRVESYRKFAEILGVHPGENLWC